MIGELDRQEIERLLRAEQIGRLGVTGDGRVYIFPCRTARMASPST
jgi:nitroimidazol reductase NimA-like FMN-containing flavoprotein (pyridoxamine 5'-phosphate oxidase superfamily)